MSNIESLRAEIEDLERKLEMARKKANYPLYIFGEKEKAQRIENQITEKRLALERLERESVQIQESSSLEGRLTEITENLETLYYGSGAKRSQDIVSQYAEFKASYLELFNKLESESRALEHCFEMAKFEQKEFENWLKQYEDAKEWLSKLSKSTPKEFAKENDVIYKFYWNNSGRKWLLEKLKTEEEREVFFFNDEKREWADRAKLCKETVEEHQENAKKWLEKFEDYKQVIEQIRKMLSEFESVTENERD